MIEITTSRPVASRLLIGDWLAPAMTAVATIGTPFLLAIVALVAMQPPGTTIFQYLTGAALLTGAAFGGDSLGYLPLDHSSPSVGTYPLTLTFVGLTIAGFLLGRQLRRYSEIWDAAGHGLRTVLSFVLLITILTLTLRTTLEFPSGVAHSGNPFLLRSGDLSFFTGEWQSNTLVAAALGALSIVLIASWHITARSDCLPPRAALQRTAMDAPVRSLSVVLLGALALGLICVVFALVTEPSTRTTTTVVVWLLTLPNIGINALYLGTGAGMNDLVASSLPANVLHETRHLPAYADLVSNWVWLLPLITLIVFTLSAKYAARPSTPGSMTAVLLRWVAVLSLASPFLAHVAASQLHLRCCSRGGNWSDVTKGLDTWQVLGLTAAWALVISLALALIARHRQGERRAPRSP